MRRWTQTQDDKDLSTPYKPFPDWPYFDFLHKLFMKEPRLFVEKSRTMMATWWGAGECFHYVMTHQPASCIFWCPDEDRAVKCISYCKVLYGQQDDRLKRLYPLKRPLDRQAVYSFEFADGGMLDALPGKNPDKIRSEHPTIVFMDEACFNEQGAEAYDNAVSTRPAKLVAVSSAAPSWFEEITKCAVPIALDAA